MRLPVASTSTVALLLLATGCSASAPASTTALVEAPDSTALSPQAPMGDLLCGALPARSVDLVLSGRDVVSVEGELETLPGDDDGLRVEGSCEIYVSGQETPALELLIAGEDAFPDDIRTKADDDAASDGIFDPDRSVGAVEELQPEGPEEQRGAATAHRAGLLVGPVVRGQVDPRRVVVLLDPRTTGREPVADSATLALQVSQVLGLPLVGSQEADVLLSADDPVDPSG